MEFFYSPKPTDVVEKVKAFFDTPYLPEPVDMSNYISPSSLSCPISAAFKLNGCPVEEEKTTFRRESIPNHGTFRHSEIQTFLARSGWVVDVEEYIKSHNLPLDIISKTATEVKVQSREFPIHCMCDGILCIDGEYYILEIKTESQAKNNVREKADSKHQDQIVTYSMLFKIPNVLFIYEGRDTLTQKYFLQKVSVAEWEKQRSYIENIVSNKTTPWLLNRNSLACTYCKYKKRCMEVIKWKNT